jgi:D-xylose transport system ATP-binding protein
MAGDGATETDLVRHMVGRDIVDLYARGNAQPGAPILEVRDLGVDDERGRPRLRGIGFTLHAGEVLGIGGLMGAGRSELLMHLFGAWGRRTQGEVRLAGTPYAPRDPKAALASGVALLTEDRRRYGLHLDETIGFNLSLSSLPSLATAGIVRSGTERLQNTHWYDTLDIRAAGLAAVAGRLSGGNQQKVVLGKALMTRPRVILLDEPSRGIDIGAKAEIYARINTLTAQGCAVLLVSGDLPELLGLSDRILMLHAGTVAGTHAGRDATAQTLLQAALGLPGGSRP